MRYFLKLAYKGTDFHGWQIQPNAVSVQETLEKSLSLILRFPTEITAAGRTDAGVHARVMYAHFDTKTPIENKEKFLKSLNSLTGKDISVYDLIKVATDAHARFDAIERTYKYFVDFSRSPFLYPYSWQCPSPLDLDSMNLAAQELLKVDDFTSFAKLHTDNKTNICKVSYAQWEKLSSPEILYFPPHGEMSVFTITADRFLRNMVRAIVGTLVDVGRHKLSIDSFKRIIEMKDRCKAGTSMPAEGLFLWDIRYPYL